MPRKATNLALVVRRSVPCNRVVGDESGLVVRPVQAHVDPSAVLLVAGALLQEGVSDLVVDVLLYRALVGQLNMAVQILQPGGLAEPHALEWMKQSWMLSKSSIIACHLS